MRKLIAAVTVAASAMAASARSLLYYYDFDKVENGALVYTGVNKGTGALEPTFKQSGSNPLGFVSLRLCVQRVLAFVPLARRRLRVPWLQYGSRLHDLVLGEDQFFA